MIPSLLMNVVADESMDPRHPRARSSRVGNASSPCETKKTGPSKGTGSAGWARLACPIDRSRRAARRIDVELLPPKHAF